MRFAYRAAGPITVAVVLTLLSGCSRTQLDWRTAQQANTPAAYEVFVKRHSDSELAGVARERIRQLTEQAAWRRATQVDTAAAYQDYLTKYPNGIWSGDARIRMESKSLATAPQNAMPPTAMPSVAVASAAVAPAAGGTLTAAAAPASAASSSSVQSTPPTQLTSPTANAASSPQSNSAVQLGAFSSDVNALQAWQQISTRFRSQLAGLASGVIPVTVSGRRLYRLEAYVASQSAAQRLCHQLQQQSQGCLPLP